jgi:hypothetical protein
MKKTTLFVILGALVAIQFIPVQRDNPEATAELEAPPLVLEVLKRSCYDCHSYETKWPWYSYVAPVSFLIADDVAEAREHMNFSEWNRLSRSEKAEEAEEIWEHVEKNEMPLKRYLLMHKEASLSGADMKILMDWTASIERQK